MRPNLPFDQPASRVTAALNRIHDHYKMVQFKVKRAMQFVNACSAEMVGEARRVIESVR